MGTKYYNITPLPDSEDLFFSWQPLHKVITLPNGEIETYYFDGYNDIGWLKAGYSITIKDIQNNTIIEEISLKQLNTFFVMYELIS